MEKNLKWYLSKMLWRGKHRKSYEQAKLGAWYDKGGERKDNIWRQRSGRRRKKCKKWTSNFHHFFKCRSSPPSLSLPQVRKGEAKCMVQCYKSPPLQSPSLSLPTITHQTFNLATPLWHSQVRSRRDNFHWIIETITLPSALYRGPPSRSLSLSFSLPPSFLSHSSISMERYAVNSCLSLSGRYLAAPSLLSSLQWSRLK